jgi:hypothetical protein
MERSRDRSEQIDFVQQPDYTSRRTNVFTDGDIHDGPDFDQRTRNAGRHLYIFVDSRGFKSNYLFSSEMVVSPAVFIKYLLGRSGENSASGPLREFTL